MKHSVFFSCMRFFNRDSFWITFVKVTFLWHLCSVRFAILLWIIQHLKNASKLWKFIFKIEVSFANLIELFVHFMVDIIDFLSRLFVLWWMMLRATYYSHRNHQFIERTIWWQSYFKKWSCQVAFKIVWFDAFRLFLLEVCC